ncbi:MAG: AmmeMemoRadiSam system protein A [archaeon]
MDKLVKYAKEAINAFVKKGEILEFEDLEEKKGVFVTIYKGKELRGCIGYPYPDKLGKILGRAAAGACTDPRFPPLSEDELDKIRVEVTLLEKPKEFKCKKEEIPKKIEIGKHGLIVEQGFLSGLLLPQVAVEENMSPEEFLDATCWKAGLPPGCWLDPKTKVYYFEGKVLKED